MTSEKRINVNGKEYVIEEIKHLPHTDQVYISIAGIGKFILLKGVERYFVMSGDGMTEDILVEINKHI